MYAVYSSTVSTEKMPSHTVSFKVRLVMWTLILRLLKPQDEVHSTEETNCERSSTRHTFTCFSLTAEPPAKPSFTDLKGTNLSFSSHFL